MKGFAHIGVMQALEELGIIPDLVAGTSIGAMLGAARIGGMTIDEMRERAQSLRRRDLFRLNHFGMLLERMRSPSIYLEEPLRELGASVVPDGNFDALPTPLYVNTVDLERGAPVIWGTPGLTGVNLRDAVYASCALPGYFPPGKVGDRLCVDGGVVDNLPVAIASLNADLILAVDVGSNDLRPIKDGLALGFANIYMRAATTMMHALQQFPLTHWGGPPMVLIRPRCSEDWLSFANISDTIKEGHRAARKALEDIDAFLDQPRRRLPAPAFRDRSGPRSLHRLRALRRTRAQPHGTRCAGQSVPAHEDRRLVAGRWRFCRLLPDERDRRAKDGANRAAQSRRARRSLAAAARLSCGACS